MIVLSFYIIKTATQNIWIMGYSIDILLIRLVCLLQDYFRCSRIIYIYMYYKIIDYSSYRMVSYPVSAPWSIWRRSSKMWKVDSLRTQTQAHARIQEGEVGREEFLCVSIRSTTTESSVVCSNTVPIIFWAPSNTILAVFDCEWKGMGGDEVGLKKGEGASIFDVSCLSFCSLAVWLGIRECTTC